MQGAGQTGYYLIGYLLEAGAKKIYFTEINQASSGWPRSILRSNREAWAIFSQDVDVFCPCAPGGVPNGDTIPPIKAGHRRVGQQRAAGRGGSRQDDPGTCIIYCPDFVINAGGIINVYHELHGYVKERVMADTKKIYDRLMDILTIAQDQGITSQEAAKVFAKGRIEAVRNVHSTYIPR